MKIALIQSKIIWENKNENVIKAEKWIHLAAQEHTELIFFPEMSFTGFSMDIQRTREKDYETLKKIQKIASQKRIAIGFGWVKANNERAENHYTVVDSNGQILADYTKMHSFKYGGEDSQFVAGNEICNFTLKGIRFTPFICYDLRFPEIFRRALDNTDVFVIPANWPMSRREHWKCLLQARAIENQAYVLGINCVDEMNGITYSGDSSVFSPIGEKISSLAMQEGVIFVEVNEDDFAIRKTFPVREDIK